MCDQIPRPTEAVGLPVAELAPVYEYSCDKCGMLNVVRPGPAEPEPEDAEAFGDGQWQSIPVVVQCRSCGTKYASRMDHERFEDEQPD